MGLFAERLADRDRERLCVGDGLGQGGADPCLTMLQRNADPFALGIGDDHFRACDALGIGSGRGEADLDTVVGLGKAGNRSADLDGARQAIIVAGWPEHGGGRRSDGDCDSCEDDRLGGHAVSA